jgi:predicted RecA/RadA family phage recombinase
VATADAGNGATVEAQITGVVELAKVSAQAWTVGALIYWDNAARLATTVSTSNKLIGVATAVAQNPSSTGRVRLNAAFIS